MTDNLSRWLPGWHSTDILVSSLSLLASYVLFRRTSRVTNDKDDRESESPAYILPSYIHHARMLPKESTHVFRYPTLYFTFSLSALETGRCNRGWNDRLFHWNGPSKKRAVTALEANDYLSQCDEKSWLRKVQKELQSRGYLESDTLLEDKYETWAVTMPNFLGLHGINPLTVYYIYHKEASSGQRAGLWLCLLEVHNTFSERHLYVLPAGVGEDRMDGHDKDWELLDNSSPTSSPPTPPSGDGLSWPVSSRRQHYDHQWTFPRSFHVSPFNDRSGFYRLYLRDLWQPGESLPTMDIRLLLLTPDEAAQETAAQSRYPPLHKKLLATLSSHDHDSHRRPRPMTSTHLIKALAHQPLDLTLTFARIAFQAAKLHYGKRLNVFGKPDVTARGAYRAANGASAAATSQQPFDGIGWPISTNATQLEREERQQIRANSEETPPVNGSLHCSSATSAQLYFYEWFREMASQSPSISVKLVQVDGTTEVLPSQSTTETDSSSSTLVIYLLSHAFFADLALYGSPPRAFLLGSRVGRRWGVNDAALFHRFFAELPRVVERQPSRALQWTQSARAKHAQWACSLVSEQDSDPTVPDDLSALDDVPTERLQTWTFYSHVLSIHCVALLEYKVFGWTRAKYVEGHEPWLEYKRGVELLRAEEEKRG